MIAVARAEQTTIKGHQICASHKVRRFEKRRAARARRHAERRDPADALPRYTKGWAA